MRLEGLFCKKFLTPCSIVLDRVARGPPGVFCLVSFCRLWEVGTSYLAPGIMHRVHGCTACMHVQGSCTFCIMHRQHAHASRARMRTPHGHAWRACHAQPACTYFLLVKYSTPSAISATMVMKLMGNSTNADAAMMSFMMCFLCRLRGPFGPPCDSRLGVCVLSN